MASSKAAVRVIDSQLEEQSVAPLIRDLLGRLGEDPQREGLVRTPERVAEALRFMTSGHRTDVHRLVNGALYDVEYDAMVVNDWHDRSRPVREERPQRESDRRGHNAGTDERQGDG
jgi:GTP cyclohydrolase I